MRGKIIKSIAGFYEVHTGDEVYRCRAKGIFRALGKKPLVGDDVEIDITDTVSIPKEGNVRALLPRKNELVRPNVANVDQALLIFAITHPAPSYNMLDRFLITMQERELDAILCFNKRDIATEEEIRAYASAHPAQILPDDMLVQAKKDGFSDKYLSEILGISEEEIRNHRIELGVEENWEGVHVSGTENSAYYYSTYNGEDKNPVSDNKKIMILGGGPNRIGQGIEFDYCCVQQNGKVYLMNNTNSLEASDTGLVKFCGDDVFVLAKFDGEKYINISTGKESVSIETIVAKSLGELDVYEITE